MADVTTIAVTDARYEVKLVARPSQRDGLVTFMRLHKLAFGSPYPARCINNVYFDTLDLRAYYDNLAGERSRRKLRYRWYGRSRAPLPGTLEIKAKLYPLGWKKLCPIVGQVYAPGDSWRVIIDRLRSAVPAEAATWLAMAPQVVLLNRYEREYFVSRDGRLRVTFDRDLRIYDQRFSTVPNLDRKALLPPSLIIEVKCGPSGEAEMKRFLEDLPVRVGRFSKYTLGLGGLIA
jgi:hypothetical protein